MIIFPAIDIVSGKCVRLYQGDYDKKIVYADSPAEVALDWEKQGAEYLHLVDLDGAKEGKIVNLDSIKDICSRLQTPCELGGGIRTIEDAQLAFDSGVSRIIIGTAAIRNPDLVTQLIDKFGAEQVVLGIDARDGKVAVSGWLETTGMEAIKLAENFASIGIKRFIYTDISKDGALCGPNLEMTAKFCERLDGCFVIASGGIGSINHIKDLIKYSKLYSNLEGVIVGKALYEKKISLSEISLLK